MLIRVAKNISHNSTFPSFNLSIFTEENGISINNKDNALIKFVTHAFEAGDFEDFSEDFRVSEAHFLIKIF